MYSEETSTRLIDGSLSGLRTKSQNGHVQDKREVKDLSIVNEVMIKDYATTITILESLRDAIFLLDAEGKIQYANRTALGLLHVDISSITEKYIDEIITENGNGVAEGGHGERNANILKKLETGIQGNIEAYLHYLGTVVPVLLDFSVVEDCEDSPQFIVVSAKDFTQRKMIESERKQQQAKSIAHDRLRALGELSVGLVHELSQPLASLRLKVELLQNNINQGSINKDSLLCKSREILTLIYRMSETIQNMRSFAHQTEVNTVGIVNVHETIRKATALVEHDLRSRNIKMRVEGTHSLPYIIANPLLIEQVIVNLLTNCRDAFDDCDLHGKKPSENDKSISINTRTHEGKWVDIVVSDNAGGMNNQVMKRIFEPFFTTKEPETNSGLGLTISKNIITSLGGNITALNLGFGTRMRIRIPLHRQEEHDQVFSSIEMMNYTG